MAKKSLLGGAAVLAAAGIIVKFIGAFFRIPLANFIGDVGMAYYYPAYPTQCNWPHYCTDYDQYFWHDYPSVQFEFYRYGCAASNA